MKLKNSIEYQNVISYMTEVLGNEFPIKEFSPEYIMLSILDNYKCHASIILDSILMSDDIECLKDYYSEKIKEICIKPILGEKGMKFDTKLSLIMSEAEEEADFLSSATIGTEHILLSILNPANKLDISDKLFSIGLKYDYILEKCSDFKSDSIKDKPSINNNNQQMNAKIPLKSEINAKSVVQNGKTPFIDKYTTNLHEEIAKGKCDNLIGREDILENIIKVLSRRKKNNVILVGKAGTGKTSIGYGLAQKIESGQIPEILEKKQVVKLNSMALISGTHLRGMFEERVNGLFDELKNNPNYILFIDDMQNVIKSTNKDRDSDLSDLIGNILSGGDVRVIGTISFKSYRNGIENNPVLSTKLQKIVIEPSTKEETFNILQSNKHYYEDFHHVKFNDDCLWYAIKLAKRYITNNCLPDSAIDVIDLTGASISLYNKQSESLKKLKEELEAFNDEKKSAMECGNFEKLDEISKKESLIEKNICDMKKELDNNSDTWINITKNDIANTISSMTNIPVSKLSESNKTTILNIDSILKKDVIGQDDAINEIAKAIKRSRAGFSDNNKCTTILEIGETGCGKTLIAKKLALNVYGDENALIRFDMSEYQDKTSVNKLLGSSAGYVGYENGGLLTEAIKNKPYCVLLFDEIEKADESIYNVFLQLFDEGRLTDNYGTTVNFKNVIVIMTSNIGAKQASELGNGVGFNTNIDENKKTIINKTLKNKFNPEFLNRIDKIIYFNSLNDDNIRAISKIEMDKLVNRVKENNVIIKYDDSVIEYVYNKAIQEREYGARPIMRIIQDNISDKIVDYVLASDVKESEYYVYEKDDKIEVKVNAK